MLQREGPEVMRQGKDHMDIGRLEYLAFPGGEPRGLRGAVTCGTAAVATGVVRLLVVPAGAAGGAMAPEGGGPTQRDGAEGPLLRTRENGPIARQKGVAMLTHDIGHFQWRPTHGTFSKSAGNASASRGLSVAW